MIKIYLGNIGSGKTLSCVRDMTFNKLGIVTFTNIQTTNIPKVITINKEMIIKKTLIESAKKVKYDYSLNLDFWKEQIDKYKKINVVIDEAHTIMNARRSGSKVNIILTDFLSLLRRILGSNPGDTGELILISQLSIRLDVVARSMSSQIRYHKCYYEKKCQKCGFHWDEDNEMPELLWQCPSCHGLKIKKYNHLIEVFCFQSVPLYLSWQESGTKTYYDRYYITDSEKYFDKYNSLQWDNLISEY